MMAEKLSTVFSPTYSRPLTNTIDRVALVTSTLAQQFPLTCGGDKVGGHGYRDPTGPMSLRATAKIA